MNEVKWIEKDREANPNRHPMPSNRPVAEDVGPEAREISEFEAREGHPYIVEKLRISNDFRIDPAVEAKALAVDDFIRSQSHAETTASYDMTLTRLLEGLPESLESILLQKGGVRVLERMFTEASISNKKSSDGYLEEYRRKLAIQKSRVAKTSIKISIKSNSINIGKINISTKKFKTLTGTQM